MSVFDLFAGKDGGDAGWRYATQTQKENRSKSKALVTAMDG